MIIPLGAWCRTAYQVNEFKKAMGIEPVSFPFDWTVTPLESIKCILDSDFEPTSILQQKHLELNPVKSITDKSTKLIHHHDFLPQKMEELIAGSNNKATVPLALFQTELITKARNRFVHTYKNLEKAKKAKNKILFIRWLAEIHGKIDFAEISEDENISCLAAVIEQYLSHQNFSILSVRSITIDKNMPVNPIVEYTRQQYGVSACIYERNGLDGDGTKNFRGDTYSWKILLNKFTSEEYK